MTAPVDDFKAGMRRLAAGVSVITTSSDAGDRLGITATAVCSLTIDPPSLLVAVNRSTGTGAVIAETGRLCVNVLAVEHRDVACMFAGMTGVNGPERFAVGTWMTAVTGAPVLSDALASFDCRTKASFDHGTHTVFVGEVQAVHLNAGDGVRQPLVYVNGNFTQIAEPVGAA